MCLLHPAETSTADDFCQSETFQPRCLAGETVIITKAVYGRMSHSSRCLQEEEVLPALRDDPRHMGCFENVLQLVSERCSGQPDCEIRIPDPEMEKTSPCYRYTVKYLEAQYQCIRSKSYIYSDCNFYAEIKGVDGQVWYRGWEVPRCFFCILPNRSIPKPDKHRKDIIQQESLGNDIL